MISSMTGFGREVLEDGRERIAVEVRSVNARGQKLAVRLPQDLAAFQPEVEALVRATAERGTVQVDVEVRTLAPAQSYTVDPEALRRYALEVAAVKSTLGISDPVDVEALLSLPGVIVERPSATSDATRLFERVRAVVERALAAFAESRRREGASIAGDIAGRRRAISGLLAALRVRVPEALAGHRARLEERMRALLEGTGVAVETADVVREVALFAERTDVSEELSRLATHLDELDRILAQGGVAGRRLEFLVQEMMREANTLGSKTQESGLIQDVLAIKLEVDRIKEQVANVE